MFKVTKIPNWKSSSRMTKKPDDRVIPTDGHTLKISFGIATMSQVLLSIEEIVKRATNILGEEPKYRLNINHQMDNQIKSWGYLYTPNVRFYSLLLGESKTIKCDDKDWVPPTSIELKWMEKIYGTPKELGYDSWNDIAKKSRPSKIKKNVPILEIKNIYPYNEQQKEKHLIRFGTRVENGHLKFEPAIPRVPKDGDHENVIVSHFPIPSWLTVDKIYKIFGFFNTSQEIVDSPVYSKKGNILLKNKVVKRFYPIVTLSSNKLIIIKYNPKTNDAIFALLISPVIYQNGGKNSISFSFQRK